MCLFFATPLLRGRRYHRGGTIMVMGRAYLGAPCALRMGGAQAGPERR